ncbi:MAG: trypsin-like peptidase domain-containing protein [Planctomycetia bacterium]|nr:trypsin-like peptidase domain-containing protein [Planctomycetia bacterium]
MSKNLKILFMPVLFAVFFSFPENYCIKAIAECRQARNMEDVHYASCRVHASKKGSRLGSIGTGTVCLKTEGKYWILTNWHVVQGADEIKLHFFGNGSLYECSGKVENVWYDEKAPFDFAIITVLEEDLAPYDPPFVPLGPQGTVPEKNKTILSSGCSEGRWAMAWKGMVDSYYGNTAQFLPAPKSGQSGSAIVQKIDGNLCISGLLTWRVGDENRLSEENMRGGAIPIALLYYAADGRKPAGNIDNVPPSAVWVNKISDERDCPDRNGEEDNSPMNVRRLAIMDADAYFRPVAETKRTLAFAAYTVNGCVPCKNAIPILENLKKEGYPIHVIPVDSPAIQNRIRDLHIEEYPTFILFSLEGETWKELERFTNVPDLEERIRTSFARFLSIDLKRKESGSIRDFLDSQRERREKNGSSDNRKNRDSETPSLGKMPNGDISPLLDAYRNPKEPKIEDKSFGSEEGSARSPEKKKDSESRSGIFAKDKKEKEDNTVLFKKSLDDLSSGIQERLNGLSGKAEEKIKKRIDDITADLVKKGEALIKAKIEEVRNGLQKQLTLYLQRVFWRAVLIIAAVWYLLYWAVCGVRKMITMISTVPFPLEIRYSGKSSKSS